MVAPSSQPPVQPARRPTSWRKWLFLAVAAVVVSLAVYNAVNPYDERGYVPIPHGDHVHWVPRDRDASVPISNFPTVEPGPNERLLPDGRVVPIQR
jgi:hypothetical protein